MVDSRLWEFRSFILAIRDEAAHGWGEAQLVPWIEQRRRLVEELQAVGGRGGHRRPVTPGDDVLTGLYAVSRLVDILIGPHQPANDDPSLVAWTTGEPWWSGPVARLGTQLAVAHGLSTQPHRRRRTALQRRPGRSPAE